MAARSNIKAAIYGCEGERLTPEEKCFFKTENPFGFILFARNCGNPDQIRALTAEMREVTGRERLAILIDQEGGRVARLKPPFWRASPAAARLAQLTAIDPEWAKSAVYLNARLLGKELNALGITVNCAPLADIPVAGSHEIIGDRAYGTEPEQVTTLARAMAEGLLDSGVLPVLKHIPGHGRAMADSHKSLPIVDTPLAELEKTDFIPFRALRDLPFGMTAHVLYTALDSAQVATLSSKAIRYIREEIGFDHVLMSDDLSMKALKGGMKELARHSLEAGCDLVLHCNGKMDEMQQVSQGASLLSPGAMRRTEEAWGQLRTPSSLDPIEGEQELTALLNRAVA